MNDDRRPDPTGRAANLANHHHRASRTQGQALVELALILPVFLLLLASTLDLGRLFYSQITVNDAAREGALEASRNPALFIANTACTAANRDANRIMCRTLNEARGGFVTIAPTDVSLACSPTPCPTSAALGNTVSVSVTGHFTLITPLLAGFFGGQNVTFNSTSSAQLLSVPTVAVTGAVASFTASPTSGAAPLAVSVTDTSSNGPTTWAWAFGDGTTYNGQFPPAHSYGSAGTYTITLTVSNASGVPSTATRTISVSAPVPAAPVADFSASPSSGSVPLNVTFTDLSTGTPTSWSWTFGDGTSSTLQTPPVHTYSTTGVYSVTLTVSNAGGSNSKTKTVNAAVACPSPVASFTVNPTSGKKKQASFVVTDGSTGLTTSGCNNTWSWNYGDGSGNSSLQNPPGYVYNAAGTYTIQLTVSTYSGSSTAMRTVTVTH